MPQLFFSHITATVPFSLKSVDSKRGSRYSSDPSPQSLYELLHQNRLVLASLIDSVEELFSGRVGKQSLIEVTSLWEPLHKQYDDISQGIPDRASDVSGRGLRRNQVEKDFLSLRDDFDFVRERMELLGSSACLYEVSYDCSLRFTLIALG